MNSCPNRTIRIYTFRLDGTKYMHMWELPRNCDANSFRFFLAKKLRVTNCRPRLGLKYPEGVGTEVTNGQRLPATRVWFEKKYTGIWHASSYGFLFYYFTRYFWVKKRVSKTKSCDIIDNFLIFKYAFKKFFKNISLKKSQIRFYFLCSHVLTQKVLVK